MKIEKNIPLPDKSVRGALVKMLRQLGVGDSILIEKVEENKVHSNASRIGIKCVKRKDSSGMVRVWRVL